MSQRPLIELRKTIRAKAVEIMGDGMTTGQLLLRINEDHAADVEAARDELANLGLQRIVQDALHKPGGEVDPRQGKLKLPLPPYLARLDPPEMISVPVRSNSDAEEVKWMPLRKARLADLQAHLGLLHRSISHDQARARKMARVVRILGVRMTDSSMTVGDVISGGGNG